MGESCLCLDPWHCTALKVKMILYHTRTATQPCTLKRFSGTQDVYGDKTKEERERYEGARVCVCVK